MLAAVVLATALMITGGVTARSLERPHGTAVRSATGLLTNVDTSIGTPPSTTQGQSPLPTSTSTPTTTVPVPVPGTPSQERTSTAPGAGAPIPVPTTTVTAITPPAPAAVGSNVATTPTGATTSSAASPGSTVARGVGSVVDPTPVAPPTQKSVASVPAVPTDPTATRNCKPDPSAVISALPLGGTFHGQGCYSVPHGIEITQPVTIDGGTYIDTTTTPPPFTGHGAPQLNPIIAVVSAGHVTLENLTVEGTNEDGGFHAALVGQAGIKLESTRNTTIQNVTTSDTFGDGLELWIDFRPGYGYPVTNLNVDGLTVRQAGRQGITFGDVNGATLTNIAVDQAADSGVDFESDLPHVGSGDVSIANSTICYCGARTSINSIDYLSGPVQLTNDTLAGHFVVENPQSAFGFTMTGGSLALPRDSPGTPPSGIYASRGGHIKFIGVKFSFIPGPNPTDGRNLMSTDTSTISIIPK